MANEFEFPWIKMMNVEPTLIERGKLGFTHTPQEIHLNHNNDINASVLYCLGEMSGSGVLVVALGEAAKDAFVVIKSGTIDYHARASGVLTTEASLTDEQIARVEKAVKEKASIEETVEVIIKNSEDTIVAKCNITSVLKPKKRD